MARRKTTGESYVVLGVEYSEVRKALTGLPKELRRELRKPFQEAGDLVKNEMLARVPRASGTLAGGIKRRVVLQRLIVRVESTARKDWRGQKFDYGRALEFDRKRYKGRYKWFYPAWDATRDRAREMYWEAVQRALDRAVR